MKKYLEIQEVYSGSTKSINIKIAPHDLRVP